MSYYASPSWVKACPSHSREWHRRDFAAHSYIEHCLSSSSVSDDMKQRIRIGMRKIEAKAAIDGD